MATFWENGLNKRINDIAIHRLDLDYITPLGASPQHHRVLFKYAQLLQTVMYEETKNRAAGARAPLSLSGLGTSIPSVLVAGELAHEQPELEWCHCLNPLPFRDPFGWF